MLFSSATRHLFHSTRYDERSGLTPFHLACAHPDAPSDVLEAMIESDRANLLVRSRGEHGASPIHLACEMGSAQTVHILLRSLDYRAYEEVQKIDGLGHTALKRVWLHHLVPGFRSYDREKTQPEDVRECVGEWEMTPSRLHMDALQLECWKKTTHLLFVSDTGKGRFEEFSAGPAWTVMHCIAQGGGRTRPSEPFPFCPTLFLWIALRVAPEQVRWQDEDGNFPLHLAARGRPLRRIFEDVDNLGVSKRARLVLRSTQATSIEMLVTAYPRSARICNEDRRLPLHLAAASGKGWEGEVEPIVRAAPAAVNTRDAQTHLYPFMLAAEGAEFSLDSTYMLLKANPSLIKSGIKKTTYEIYLENHRANDQRTKEDEMKRKEFVIAELQLQLKKRKYV